MANYFEYLEDDDDDTLLFERLQEHILHNQPNPRRIGCPSHAVLETFVASPAFVTLEQLNVLHIFECAECTQDLIELRQQRETQRPSEH